MTVIAVKKLKNKIEIASDSQVTYGYQKKELPSHYNEMSKMFKANDMVIAGAGSAKGIQLLRVFAKNHKPKTATSDDILEFIVEFEGWAKKKDDKFDLSDNAFIFIMEGKVFEAVDGFLVTEVSTHSAIGSGSFIALGALYFGHSVEEAVEVAIEHDIFCGGKIEKEVIDLD